MRTRLRYGRDVEILRTEQKFKTAMFNLLRALMEKVDNMQGQMGNISRQIEVSEL